MFNLVINIVESLIITLFFMNSVNLKRNIRKILAFIIIFTYSLISTYIIENIASGTLSSIICILTNSLILFLIAIDSFTSLLTLSLISRIFIIIANQTVFILISLILGISLYEIFENSLIIYVSLLIAKIILALLCYIIIRTKKGIDDLLTSYSKTFICIFFVSYIAISFLQDAIYRYQFNYSKMVIISYLSLISAFLVIILVFRIKKDSIQTMNINILEKEMNSMKDQFNLYKKSNEEISILRHDMMNIMMVISDYLDRSETKKAQNYLLSTIDKISQNKPMIITGNTAVDCVLNACLSKIKEKDINFITNINKICLNRMDDLDIAILLANSISNAIENISNDNPYLEINIQEIENYIEIKIINSVDIDVFKNNPELTTSKEDPEKHGFGIKSIRDITQKYNGTVNFYQNDNLFVLSINIPF